MVICRCVIPTGGDGTLLDSVFVQAYVLEFAR
jgi:hypothetical protein